MKKTLIFQGDSITDCGRKRDMEETAETKGSGLGNGYVQLIAARLLLDRCDIDWDIRNRGISGNRIVDLYARWKSDTLNIRPDILSIMIGVNDTWHEKNRQNGVEVPRYERIYRELLQWTVDTLPDIKLVIMEPYVLNFGAVSDDWVPEMDQRREVCARLAKEFDATFIPTQSIFNDACKVMPPEYWLADGVHPRWAGHQLIADAWLKAVEI